MNSEQIRNKIAALEIEIASLKEMLHRTLEVEAIGLAALNAGMRDMNAGDGIYPPHPSENFDAIHHAWLKQHPILYYP